jgi:beta-galactosidase
VILGKNGDGPNDGADMYTVIVHRKSVLELPPPEPRPTTPYEAESASSNGPVLSTDLKGFSGKGYVHFTEPSGSVEWTISVGVGDLYALRFTYQNPTGRDIPMLISVTAADGKVLHSDTAYFEPTVKWDLHKTNTGTSINAGTYKVKLVGREAMGLSLDLLKVQ